MTRTGSSGLLLAATLVAVATAAQQPPLTIVNTGPDGPVDSLEQANEIRIVFSEPMVALGRIPRQVDAPFVTITPRVPGTFRWSGTTILIFTPDPKRPLSYATTYQVTVDTTARAVSGRTLETPTTFRFTTPAVRLLRTTWYRRGGTVDKPMVVLLRFNQAVRPRDVAAHLTASLQRHTWDVPAFTAEEEARLRAIDPSALAAFSAKVQATQLVAAGGASVALRLTNDWDKKRYPPSPDLVAFETTTPVRPESWVRLVLDERLPSPAGPGLPPRLQTFTIRAERAFFIEDFDCTRACDADDRNSVRMRAPVKAADLAAAVRATDITAGEQPVAKAATPRGRPTFAADASFGFTLEDAGYEAQLPDRQYSVTVPPTLKSADGQTLGYRWLGIVDNWHMRAFTSFGDGHGVWESSGGSQLPFYARNLQDVRQWVSPLDPSELMPRLQELRKSGFSLPPPANGVDRRLAVTADRLQSHGLSLTGALRPGGTGLVWTAVREGEPLPRTRRFTPEARTRASIVQVTNLGITVKDSPQNTLVFVTRLDTGVPVPGASVSIVRQDNSTFWRGTTGPDGVAVAPETPLREADNRWGWEEFAFVVIAEKDGDVAYVGSDWTEGISPWDFGIGLNLREREPLLRGSVFTDRGVYRLGEEVHFKAVLRQSTPTGVRLLTEGTAVQVSVRDTENRLVDQRLVRVSPWSSAEWTMALPASGALGTYRLRAILEADIPKPKTPEQLRPGETPSPDADEEVPYERVVQGSFLVAAYRRPDFRVDVSLSGPGAVAGDALKGLVTARYLFGATMGARPVTWRYSKTPGFSAPSAVTEKFGADRWVFVGSVERSRDDQGDIRRAETTLQAAGDLPLSLDTRRDAGIPYVYSLEGDVEDVSRQHIANRASLTVHPAPTYVGLLRPSFFIDQKAGLRTEVVTVAPDGMVAAGVPVTVKLIQLQWTSVRRAEGNGFYTWETERKEIPSGSWTVTTGAQPVPLTIPFKTGGLYVLEARTRADKGRHALTRTSFYVLGDGYTSWQRFDHNRIELVPERQTYKPGDTARIMIQSPWEQATALVTTEREGIRSHRQFALTSTQQSIAVPIAEDDIPNVFVSVLLVKGRSISAPSDAAATRPNEDVSDPGKPSFRLGYVELNVEDRAKRLDVSLATDRQEYRPASKASVQLDVKDADGRGAASEVTLWAVDYGVLSLTSYQAPDVAGSVYARKALQVLNTDNRQRIISRRVLTPKGESDGGGGGQDSGAGALRKDFRVLAFWLGSVATDANGRATVGVTLPESLTTYRIMAVAADRRSRFGSGEAEVRTNKPVTLKPTFPRFLAVGDTAFFGAVVGSQLPAAGAAVVTMRSLDPRVLDVPAGSESRVNVAPGGTTEVRFTGRALAIGRARIQVRVEIGEETDAFEDVIPVEVLASPETVAAYGEAAGTTASARETIAIPSGVVPGFGGLHVEVSSTAMVGLGEGARYLVEYPYGCAEQKASSSLALLLAADLGDAFSLPGMDPSKMRSVAQSTLDELVTFQCSSGGFAYWPGACQSTSPYLTAYVLHVLKKASDLEYDVDRGVRDRAYDYLQNALAASPPDVNEGWWPAYTAWQAFAVKVLAEGGRSQDSHLTRLYGYRDRMPVFALAYLHDALLARGETTGERVADLRRRMSNAILPEGGSAHVGELADPYLLWFWNSNVRSTAIVLNSFVNGGVAEAPMRQMVRWMMAVRKDGRWGNTQENAHAMEALVAFYRRYESVVPDFRAVVSLGARELASEQFRGRSAEASTVDVPLAQVLSGATGDDLPLTFRREGEGTLYYAARLRYAVGALFQEGLDSGFHIERRYEPYLENGSAPPSASYAAGDLVRVTLSFRLTKERRFVAVTDPLPAGFEAVESWFATTARDLSAQQDRQTNDGGDASDWRNWWRHSGFDRVERHDDRVQLFATRLGEGFHEFSYIVRATTAGTFRTAPTRAEEMYEPEVFGRTATTVVEVKR